MSKTDILIQENGKALGHFVANYEVNNDELREVASQYINDTTTIKKIVIVPDRLVNIITE